MKFRRIFLGQKKKNKSGDFKVTHRAPCNLVACFCFPDVRTDSKPRLKIMITYTAGAWWVNRRTLLQYTEENSKIPAGNGTDKQLKLNALSV